MHATSSTALAVTPPLPDAGPQGGVTLRWYQNHAVDAVFRVWEDDPEAAPVVVIPTGGGKSLILAEICRRFLRANPRQRTISAVHVRELVSQNFMAFRKIAPDLSSGIYSASLNRRDTRASVTFATVQSIVRVANLFSDVGLILVDEAHLIPHSDDGQYRELINAIRAVNPNVRLVGATATPWRTNSGNLCEPYGDSPPIFTEVAFELTVLQLLREGFLCPAVAKATKVRMSTEGVKQRGGEYIESELDKKLNTDTLNQAIVEDAVAQIEDRRSVLVFAISVDHATRLRDHFRRCGVSAEMVSGATPKEERDRFLAMFKAGKIKVLTNCQVLTTGFDAPQTDCLIFARPTNSPGLFAQMGGRGLRIADGKETCLILDYAGNTMRHGLLDQIKGVFKRGKGRKDPDESQNLKECDSCGAYCSRGDKVCHACGAELAATADIADREKKLFKKITSNKAMTEREELKEFQVTGARVVKHEKPGKPATLKLSYIVPGEPWPISEWLCFDHKTDEGHAAWAAKKAREQWRRLTSAGKPPKSVDEALSRAHELRRPTRIWVRKDGEFFRVEGFSFAN